MTETSAAVTALAADQTPAAAPVDPTVAAETSSSETATDKGDSKPKRVRTSIRGLRVSIADLQRTNEGLRARLNAARTTLYTTEDRLVEETDKLGTAEKALASARTALELVVSILSLDKSPADAAAFFPEKAREYGFDFRSINGELLDALGKAYAKAPQRAADAANKKAQAAVAEKLSALVGGRRGELRSVSGSGLDGLMETLLGLALGDGDPTRAGCGDPSCPSCS